MKISIHVFLLITTVQSIGCYKTDSKQDEDEPFDTESSDSEIEMEPSRCGEAVIEAHALADGCAVQGVLSLPDYTSEEGYSCSLNVRLVDELPEMLDSEICDITPNTSTCLLQLIDFIQAIDEMIPSEDRYSFSGFFDAVEVCTAGEGCGKGEEDCSVCQDQQVFIPCEFTYLSTVARPFS